MSRLWIDLLTNTRIESGDREVFFGTVVDSLEPFTQVNDLIFTDSAAAAREYGPYILRCVLRLEKPRVITLGLPDALTRDTLALQGDEELDAHDGVILVDQTGSKLYRPQFADQITILARVDA